MKYLALIALSVVLSACNEEYLIPVLPEEGDVYERQTATTFGGLSSSAGSCFKSWRYTQSSDWEVTLNICWSE